MSRTVVYEKRGRSGHAPWSIAVALFAFQALAANAEPVMVTVAGGGDPGDGIPATEAALSFPTGVALDVFGNLYFSDETFHSVRKVRRSTGEIVTIAGVGTAGFSGDGGPAVQAKLNLPIGIAVAGWRYVYVAEKVTNRVRRIDQLTGIITTVAGNGEAGYNGDGIPADQASLRIPVEVGLDLQGNLFIVDQDNHRIRKVDGQSGVITTVAGNGEAGYGGDGGPATAASLNFPAGVVIDRVGNMFIADKGNNRIRRVNAETGTIITIAGNGVRGFGGDGGLAWLASFDRPANVILDREDSLLVVDEGNNVIRKIRSNGVITTVVGNGNLGFNGDGIPATDAELILPTGFSSPGVALNADGDLFFADRGNQRVRRIDAESGQISTVAGGGNIGNRKLATEAHLVVPASVDFASDGAVIICDRGNNQIRRIDPVTGVIEAYVGTGVGGYSGDGGHALDAQLTMPLFIVFDSQFNLYIADQFNQVIRRVDAVTKTISTYAGNGTAGGSGDGGLATDAKLQFPLGLALDADDNLYIADQYNSRIRRVDRQTGIITTVAGSGLPGYDGDGGPATGAKLALPVGIAFDPDGSLYIADRQHNVVRRVDADTGTISRYAGFAINGIGGFAGYAGDGGPARFSLTRNNTGVGFDPDGNLHIADFGNGAIRKVDKVTGIISTVAGTGVPGFSGDGGPPTEAQLNLPLSVRFDADGNMFIGDVPNSRIRAVIQSP